MRAIVTKYIPPTNHRGARIKATAGMGATVIIPYPYELNIEAAHRSAAVALCTKMDWAGQLVQGGLEDGRNVFTLGEEIATPDEIKRARLMYEDADRVEIHAGATRREDTPGREVWIQAWVRIP